MTDQPTARIAGDEPAFADLTQGHRREALSEREPHDPVRLGDR